MYALPAKQRKKPGLRQPAAARKPAHLSLLYNGMEADFPAAARLGFTHVLARTKTQISAALSNGLAPIAALHTLCAETLQELQVSGATGFYFHAAHEYSSGQWRQHLDAIRHAYPDILLIADILGGLPEQIVPLRQAGFDYATSSSCYWDFASGWINRDTDRTEAVAMILALATPPGTTHWQNQAARRALRFSALFAPGWAVDCRFILNGGEDLRNEVQDLLALRRDPAEMLRRDAARLISTPGAPAAILQRGDAVLAVNHSLEHETTQYANVILPQLDCSFLQDCHGNPITAGGKLILKPGEVCLLRRAASPLIMLPAPRLDTAAPRIAIERLEPDVDSGRFAARRVVGETVSVKVDLIADGHEKLAAELLYRAADEPEWQRTPLSLLGNDCWSASFPLKRLGRHIFKVQAWLDRFATYADGLRKKIDAGQDVSLELREGLQLVVEATHADARFQRTYVELQEMPPAALLEHLLSPGFKETLDSALPRKFLVASAEMPIDAEPRGARFASWYEIFPRSQSGDAMRHGTFADVTAQLPRIAAMGFDVLYFPPIHPIGETHRKGCNNALQAKAGDPGSPYAIGSDAGGHDAIHPELGTLEDFRALVCAAEQHGLAIALDFAIQCSPDHPWLRNHKDWFNWRPDGSLRYAENPPKKYEDIVNVDFYTAASQPDLWLALRNIVQFWVDQGIRYFRVDNPHTKPLPFWEWMIADIRSRHPDVIFLAEAFTRPKLMYRLAKLGFSQSYTYFTWRNQKRELIDYMEELAHGPAREFFRPHFFVNTPDINPFFLQQSGRGGFLIRAALAATLSGLFGVYNGFELCEAAPVPGKEEYIDSEKYEIKSWDYQRTGNIIHEIAMLNKIRRENSALQSHLGIEFLPASNGQILYYRRFGPDGNMLLIAVSLDPHHVQEAQIELPLWRLGLPDNGALQVEDLARGNEFFWHGKYQTIRLDPRELPYSIWRVLPAGTVS